MDDNELVKRAVEHDFYKAGDFFKNWKAHGFAYAWKKDWYLTFEIGRSKKGLVNSWKGTRLEEYYNSQRMQEEIRRSQLRDGYLSLGQKL